MRPPGPPGPAAGLLAWAAPPAAPLAVARPFARAVDVLIMVWSVPGRLASKDDKLSLTWVTASKLSFAGPSPNARSASAEGFQSFRRAAASAARAASGETATAR
jgi:hypothetical protein